jgi:hypothetical protein
MPSIVRTSNNSPASNQLIVDFPSRSKLKSVRFATYCDVLLIEKDTSCREMRWYSEEEFTRFRKTMIRDEIKCSCAMRVMLASEQNKSAVEDFVFNNIIGLKHLISSDVLGRCQDIRNERKAMQELSVWNIKVEKEWK